ncbi:MAG: dihydroneopterin aldolase [Hyphomicrobiales bacterium]|jgi:dihydroneopterin aldolase|nr:dihydroneopterin aldolase [Hyphomicrobiales bacterium]NBR11994.1 dihydroneopterin aldolase [Alphaproteobacteria bacterium]
MDRVRINVTKLALFAYHGVNDEEQRLGQRFYIDMSLIVAPVLATKSDLLDDTISYEDVIHCAEDAFLEKKYRTIERAASAVGSAIMAQFPTIQNLSVTVHKPSAPVAAIFDDVAVTVDFSRDG